MVDGLELLLAFFVGTALGLFNYAGLWVTVRNLPLAKHPALLSMASFMVRMVLVLAGFYLIMDEKGERLVACLLGFFLVKVASMRHFRPGKKKPGATAKGA